MKSSPIARDLTIRLIITTLLAIILALVGHATLRADEPPTTMRFVRPVPKQGWSEKQSSERAVRSEAPARSAPTTASSTAPGLKWRPPQASQAVASRDEPTPVQAVKVDSSRSVRAGKLQTLDPFENSYSNQADPLDESPALRQQVRRLTWQEGPAGLDFPLEDDEPEQLLDLRQPFQLQPMPELGEPTIEEQLAAQRAFYEPPCPTPAELKPINEVTNNIDAQPGDFPRECPLGDDVFVPRNWSLTTYTWKASALCHKPLYFEQMALERYGHTTGPLTQPFVSGAHFFATLPVLPYLMGVEPPHECIYALGYYRPGSCAPYMLYPIPISARGALLEAGAWVGGVFLIP